MSTSETGSTGAAPQTIEEPPAETSSDVGSDEEETEPTGLSLDLIFEVLKNERRREVIHYLREHDKEVTLSDLAEHIAALENDTTVASITSSQRKRVYVGLYQCHLPKMADMDIVDFNQNRGLVSLDENATELYQYLDNRQGDIRNWHRYYLSIAGFGALLFLATLVAPGSGIAGMAAMATLTVAIGVCSVVHTLTDRSDD